MMKRRAAVAVPMRSSMVAKRTGTSASASRTAVRAGTMSATRARTQHSGHAPRAERSLAIAEVEGGLRCVRQVALAYVNNYADDGRPLLLVPVVVHATARIQRFVLRRRRIERRRENTGSPVPRAPLRMERMADLRMERHAGAREQRRLTASTGEAGIRPPRSASLRSRATPFPASPGTPELPTRRSDWVQSSTVLCAPWQNRPSHVTRALQVEPRESKPGIRLRAQQAYPVASRRLRRGAGLRCYPGL
jgi:hypothetical protein